MKAIHTRGDNIFLAMCILPLLCYVFFTKWAVVQETNVSPPSLSEWVNFFVIHGGYYCSFFLIIKTLFISTAHLISYRATGIGIFLILCIIDMGYSTAIFYTGTLAPLEVAYYMSLGLGKTSLTLQEFYACIYLVGPGIILSALFLKLWRNQTERKAVLTHLFALALCITIASAIPPTATLIERNKATPSIVYLITSGIRTQLHHQAPLPAPEPPHDISVTELQPGNKPLKNIAIIVLESVGSYAIGHYNPMNKSVSPNIDQLAQQSLVAENAYSVMPHTSKALVGILCGQYPFSRHPIYESNLGLPTPCLAELIAPLGYQSVYLQSPTEHFENRRELIEHFGFDAFYSTENMPQEGFDLVNYFGPEDNIMLPPSYAWLTKQTQPFLSVYLTGTSHHPYGVPSDFPYKQFQSAKGNPELNDYLNAVSYVDNFVGKLIEQYKALDLYENTLFVIIGDHGESIGQHGRYQHNVSLYQETIKIPLIIHNPMLFGETHTYAHAASQIDLLPTLTDLIGSKPNGTFQGKSLAYKNGQSPNINPEVTTACWYERWCLASIDSEYKYIFNFDEKDEELYDLRNDPEEKYNIAHQHPAIAASRRVRLLTSYNENIASFNAYYSSLNPDYANDLAATVSNQIHLFERED